MAKITFKEFMPVPGTTGEYQASWVFTPPKGWDTFDKYEYTWQYATAKCYNNQGGYYYSDWLIGEKSTYSAQTQSGNYNPKVTYTPPDNARAIQIVIKPVSKTYNVTKNGESTTVSYWSGEDYWSEAYEVYDYYNPESAPSTPTVTMTNQRTLTASVSNYTDSKAVSVRFQIERTYNGSTTLSNVLVTLANGSATYKDTNCVVGASYRVRAQGVNSTEGTTKYTSVNKNIVQTLVYGQSEWSDWSSAVETAPDTPAGITEVRAASSTSIYVKWAPVTTATKYQIEWTDNQSYFDTSSEVESATTTGNSYIITGLDSGTKYFVRVCAVNDTGSSGYTDIVYCTVGTSPQAPTTWSVPSSVAYVGEQVNLYFVHNSSDGSHMYYGQVRVGDTSTEPSTWATHEVKGVGNESEDVEDYSYSYTLDTSSYKDGVTLGWQARTSGITHEWGEWSAVRAIDIYAQPTVSLVLSDKDGAAITGTVSSYPINVSATMSPSTQTCIGVHLAITAQTSYDTRDATGEIKHVSVGDIVYEQYFNADSNTWTYQLAPANVDLESGATYSVTATASMDSGLSASETVNIDVSWENVTFGVDATLAIHESDYSCYLAPFAFAAESGTTLPENITLAIYRRAYDGELVEVASGIEYDADANIAIVDPHPSLNYARYRIVGTDSDTGTINFTDLDGWPVDCKAAIIQWDDAWESFNISEESDTGDTPAATSMLKLLYNQEHSYNTNPVVSTVNYIGRSYPVSYYDTAIDTSVSWKCDILRDDEETLYQLRRLQIYKGDVYVRDPTGFGCWATVQVNFDRAYNSAAIPVNITITRVEGGA